MLVLTINLKLLGSSATVSKLFCVSTHRLDITFVRVFLAQMSIMLTVCVTRECFVCCRYSGITKNMLKDVTTTIEDVQAVIQALLPSNAILCGQSLNGDLRALKVSLDDGVMVALY